MRADAEQNRPVVWVNQTFAREFLDGRVNGEHLIIEGTTVEIVGVVGDVREFGLREEVRPTAYLPLNISAVPLDVMQVVARTTDAPTKLSSGLRAVVGRVDASVPVTTVRTMEEIVRASVAQMTLMITLLSIASGVSLVLGVVGLYGVTRYIVSLRTNEIGVRLALGAQPRDVRAMVLHQSLSVALVGVMTGLIAAYTVTRVLASLLFEVSARDPATFGGTTLILIAASTVAALVAANRATQIDPLIALRSE